MKLIRIIINVLLITVAVNSSAKDLAGKKEIFFEYQSKKLQNQTKAQDLGQDWSEDQLQQIYGNIGFDLNLWSHEIKMNGFLRQSESPLFKNNSSSLIYAVYPQKLIARDLFRLEHTDQQTSSKSEAILNRFTYEWGDDEVRFIAGRMFVIFGEGQTFNPINPFNHSGHISNTFNTNQGNDGLMFTLQKDPKLKLNIYIFGDKSFTDYDEEITRTVFLRGDWEPSKHTHINYTLGEDQNRHKYGVEIKQRAHYGTGYIQLVKWSQRLDNQKTNAEGLFHSLFGYMVDLTNSWNLRFELGTFEKDDTVANNIVSNFLPYEEIISLFNKFSFNDKWSSGFDLIYDRDSLSSFYKLSASYNINEHYSGYVFSQATLSETKNDTEYIAQDLIPAELGFSLRAIF